jgi:hypothetical protein
MANRKNLKVSDVTHEAVKAEQKENETIDDTLQRVLGLNASSDDLEQGIAAYLDAKQRDQVKELVAVIRDLGEFDEETEEGGGTGGRDALRFVDKGSGLTVATMECSEEGYIVQYRDNEGEMNNAFGTVFDAEEADMEELKVRTRERVEGALRRWGEASIPKTTLD